MEPEGEAPAPPPAPREDDVQLLEERIKGLTRLLGTPGLSALLARGQPACQVPGCCRPLDSNYSRRFKVCSEHRNARAVEMEGVGKSRYCQQCNAFHPIRRFEGSQKSCIQALAKHAERRRNRRALQRQRDAELERQEAEDSQPSASQTSLASQEQQQQSQQQQSQQQQHSEPALQPSAKRRRSSQQRGELQLPPLHLELHSHQAASLQQAPAEAAAELQDGLLQAAPPMPEAAARGEPPEQAACDETAASTQPSRTSGPSGVLSLFSLLNGQLSGESCQTEPMHGTAAAGAAALASAGALEAEEEPAAQLLRLLLLQQQQQQQEAPPFVLPPPQQQPQQATPAMLLQQLQLRRPSVNGLQLPLSLLPQKFVTHQPPHMQLLELLLQHAEEREREAELSRQLADVLLRAAEQAGAQQTCSQPQPLMLLQQQLSGTALLPAGSVLRPPQLSSAPPAAPQMSAARVGSELSGASLAPQLQQLLAVLQGAGGSAAQAPQR